MNVDRRAELIRSSSQMRMVRWLLVAFTLLQFTLYKPPDGVTIPFNPVPVGLGVALIVVVVNLLSAASMRVTDVPRLEWVGRAELAADTLVVLGVVGLFSFDTSSALWALLILPILEGAIRWQLRGAITTWAACAAGYLAREIFAPRFFEQAEFAVESITYRVGILLVVAFATGSLAKNLGSRIVDQLDARRESERRAELLHIVAQASRSMSSVEPENVLAAVVDASVEIGFESAALARVDEQGTSTIAFSRGLPEAIGTEPRDASIGVVGLARSLRKTVVVDEYSEWGAGLPEARAFGFRATAACPIWTAGQLDAVLVVGTRGRGVVSSHEQECLELLSAHAGAALTTARHFTERQALQARLDHEAFHDSLTGLPNRTLFRDRLEHCLERKATAPSPTAILLIDLDRFKHVNDSLGHESGDEALQVVTDRLKERRGPGDTVARYSGDQFTVLVEDPQSQRAVMTLARSIVKGLQEPFAIDGNDVYISASIGISYRLQPDGRVRDFLREADLAMQRAKEQGGGRCEAYRPVMSTRVKQRTAMERELRRAIDRDELVVHYQPAVSIETGDVVGLEALVRWHHPGRGLVAASEFIPLAQETGLIVPIGQRILDSVGAQVRAWRDSSAVPPVPVGVNLSATEFAESDFIDRVGTMLAKNRLEANDIIFEVTESVVMRDDADTLLQMKMLEGVGVRLAIDDFGLGYSSLNYLKRFRFSVLKIDRSFVTDVVTSEPDQAIVRYILALGRDLGMPVVAEGVENAEQLEFLREIGCGYVQGYYICRPVHATALAEFVASGGFKANGNGGRVQGLAADSSS